MDYKTRQEIAKLLRKLGGVDERTFRAAWDDWWKVRGRHSRARDRAETVGKHLLRHFGETRISAITVVDVEGYREKRMSEPNRSGGTVAENTVRAELALFAAAMRLAGHPVDLKALSWQPRKRREGSVRGMRAGALKQVMDEAAPWLRLLLQIAFTTGQRIRTIVSLRWADQIDLATGRLRLPPGSRRKPTGRPWLLPPVLEAARAWRAEHPDDVFVFQTRSDPYKRLRKGAPRHITARWALHAFQEACERAGVTTEDGRPVLHHLRHGMPIEARTEWGWSDREIIEWVGWSGFESYLGYGKPDDDEMRDAMERATKALQDKTDATDDEDDDM